MFKILDLYIGRTIIATTSLVLVTFVGLSGIIKVIKTGEIAGVSLASDMNSEGGVPFDQLSPEI